MKERGITRFWGALVPCPRLIDCGAVGIGGRLYCEFEKASSVGDFYESNEKGGKNTWNWA